MSAESKAYWSRWAQQLGLVEPRPRARPAPKPRKPKRNARRRASSPRVAVEKVATPATAIATATAAPELRTIFVKGKPDRFGCTPAGTPAEKKKYSGSVVPRIVGTGVCLRCRRRDQVLLTSSEGLLCRICNPDVEPPDDD
jgi:hypothetical protein